MSSKINLQTCEYACKSSIFQDNQLISFKSFMSAYEQTYYRKYNYVTQHEAFLSCFSDIYFI